MYNKLFHKYILLLIGVVLPIPIFVDLSIPGLVSGYEAQGPIPALPLSFFTLPLLIYIIFINYKYIFHNFKGINLIVIFFGIFILFNAILLVIFVNSSMTVFAMQWFLPSIYLLFSITLRKYGYFKFLFRGLKVGIAISILYIIIAIYVDFENLLIVGRINQFSPPLNGMYQVGNYTPAGLIYSGLLLLSLKHSIGGKNSRLVNALSVTVILLGGIFFGSREAFILMACSFLFFLIITIKVSPIKGMIILSFVITFLSGLTFIILEKNIDVKSIERLTRSVSEESRIEFITKRGFENIEKNKYLGRLLLPSSDDKRLTSHNTYIELVVDYGIIGVFLIIIFALLLFMSIVNIISQFLKSSYKIEYKKYYLSIIVLLVLIVSLNLRIPLIQPYSAFIIYFSIGMLIFSNRTPVVSN